MPTVFYTTLINANYDMNIKLKYADIVHGSAGDATTFLQMH